MLDVRTHKIIADFKNICHINCYVSSIDFHPHLHHLVVGCSQGNIMELHKKLSCKSSSNSHNGTVLMLAFSYDGTYLASYASDKYILVVRSKEVIFRVRTHHPCTGFAWHPWRASHLVVGYTNGQMTLYNVASNKTLTSYIPSIEQDSVILGLTFSKLTGELVTSHRINTESNCTQLNVLESFDRVVDRLSGNFGKIFYLKWSPDGTKLGNVYN
uniref:Anaphase-promoting complex subunit 4 WD40 domain-containing protein n=1 Tax=Clastoptera arizonana TaxID=38151 RepID=A0A1B6DFP0_9HEMI